MYTQRHTDQNHTDTKPLPLMARAPPTITQALSLHVSNNFISDITPGVFADFGPGGLVLWLNDNRVATLPGALFSRYVGNSVVLFVQRNNLTELPATLYCIPHGCPCMTLCAELLLVSLWHCSATLFKVFLLLSVYHTVCTPLLVCVFSAAD